MFQLLPDLNVASFVGAESARPFSPIVILLSQRAGKPRLYKTCHLGSVFSKSMSPVLFASERIVDW